MWRSQDEVNVTPHEQRDQMRRGRLKNGNPSGDFMKAPRCGARNRRGVPCQSPAMRGKRRCRLHGGKSTGAKTTTGLQRIRMASWKDGSRSARLQAEAKVQAAAEEREIFAQLTSDYDATTIHVRRLLGLPDFPKVKVRIILISPGGPPREWGE